MYRQMQRTNRHTPRRRIGANSSVTIRHNSFGSKEIVIEMINQLFLIFENQLTFLAIAAAIVTGKQIGRAHV